MARPPKNAEGPSATERMELAFWECLREMPFENITVRDIIQNAKVNRNSFYYHYDEMWDLAEVAVRNATMLEFAHMLLESDMKSGRLATMLNEIPNASLRFERLRLLAGPNGNQRLLDITKNAIVGEWLDIYELEEEQLSPANLAAIDFVFGGMTALWSSEHFSSIEEMQQIMIKSNIISNNVATLRKELAKAARAAKKAREAERLAHMQTQAATIEGSTDAAVQEPESGQMQISLF